MFVFWEVLLEDLTHFLLRQKLQMQTWFGLDKIERTEFQEQINLTGERHPDRSFCVWKVSALLWCWVTRRESRKRALKGNIMCVRSISLTELERNVCGIDVNSSEKNSVWGFYAQHSGYRRMYLQSIEGARAQSKARQSREKIKQHLVRMLLSKELLIGKLHYYNYKLK